MQNHLGLHLLVSIILLSSVTDCRHLFRTKVVVPTNPSHLQFTGFGFLTFVPWMTPSGSISPGTFVYIKAVELDSATSKMAFFESVPTPDFPLGPAIDVGNLPTSHYFSSKGLFWYTSNEELRAVIYDGDFSDTMTANQAVISLDLSAKPFKVTNVKLENSASGLSYQFMTATDFQGGRYVNYNEGTELTFFLFQGGWKKQAVATSFSSSASYYYVDTFIKVDNWDFYIDDSGFYYVFQDEINFNGPAQSLGLPKKIVPDLSPAYIRQHLFRPCTDPSCFAIVSEHRPEDKYFLAMLKFSTSGEKEVTHEFDALDVSNIGMISMPIQINGYNVVIVVASGKFHIYNVLIDKFELSPDIVTSEIAGLESDSIALGKFDSEMYPNRVPVMGLVLKDADTEAYEAVMVEIFPDGCVEGYRLTQSSTCEECTVEGCKLCAADKDTCTECKDPTKGAINPATSKFECISTQSPGGENPPTIEPPTPNPPSPTTPSEGSATVWPERKVRKDFVNNRVDVIFDSILIKPEFEARVFESKSGKFYSCAELGCSLDWQLNVLKVTFSSKIRISQGVLYLTVKTAKMINRHQRIYGRSLQAFTNGIIIPEVYIYADGWFFSWLVVAQLVLWFFRTFGSLVLFAYYPVTAMIVDQLINHCALLSLYLGPTVHSADVVVRIIGSVQLIWYRFGSPFAGWDRSTLACQARPGHASKGVACSFLDNYGSNVIGWAGLSLLTVVLHYLAVWVATLKQASPRIVRICKTIEKEYGVQYMLARLVANQPEVMLYVLISYSLADSSSKSVVGLVLATIWMGVYLVLTASSTVLLLSARKPPAARPPQASTRLEVVDTEGDRVLGQHSPRPRPQPNQNQPVNSPHPVLASVEKTSRQYLGFQVKNLLPATSVLAAAGPAVALARAFAIGILLLNHATSSVAQLVVATLLETAYLTSLFYTRTTDSAQEFWSPVALQSLAVLYLCLKAVSTNSSLPDAHRQEGLAVIMSLLLLVAALVGICAMLTVSVLLARRTADASEPKAEVRPNQKKGEAVTSPTPKLQIQVAEAEVLKTSPPLPVQHVSYLDLEVPDEVVDDHREAQEMAARVAAQRS